MDRSYRVATASRSALFTYWYARKLGMRPEGSALAALSYGFSGFMAVWLEYSTVGQVILWLPLILLAIENRWLWLITVGNAAALFAGHPQVYCVHVCLYIYLCAFSIKT